MSVQGISQVNQAYQNAVSGKLASVPSPKAMFASILEEKLGVLGRSAQTPTAGADTSAAAGELSDELWMQLIYDNMLNSATQNGIFNNGTGSGPVTAYDDIIARASKQYGLSEALIKSVIQTESSFNPNAVSSAGAIGLMQLMPSTAAGLGVTDPYDPEQNIMGGVKYLSTMIKNFNGDVRLALAGYNMGGNRVKNLGIMPNSTDLLAYNVLPSGVLSYVNKVLTGLA